LANHLTEFFKQFNVVLSVKSAFFNVLYAFSNHSIELSKAAIVGTSKSVFNFLIASVCFLNSASATAFFLGSLITALLAI
jgi:hypothetical protein